MFACSYMLSQDGLGKRDPTIAADILTVIRLRVIPHYCHGLDCERKSLGVAHFSFKCSAVSYFRVLGRPRYASTSA